LLTLLLIATTAAAPLKGTITIDIDMAHHTLSASLESELPDAPAAIASYAAAINEPYVGTDIDRMWDYPGVPVGTHFHWRGLWVDGAERDVPEHAPLIPVHGHRVRAEFTAAIPERFGLFGVFHDNALLMAPAPFVVSAPEHPTLARAMPVDWQVTVHVNDPHAWLALPQHFAGDPSGFFLASAAYGFERRGEAVYRPRPRPRRFLPGAELSVPSEETTIDARALREIADSQEWVASALARFDIPPQRWLIGALRREPTRCAQDALIVSRELFRVAPAPQILAFHRYGLARYAFACATQRAWNISAEDADALGAYLANLVYRESVGVQTDAMTVFRPLAFLPDVDSLIYAPKLPWAQLYFNAVDESLTGPPEPDDFFHNRPAGKIIYEKLRDRLGPATTDKLFLTALTEHKPPSALAPAADIKIIREDFLGPYPEYDVHFRAEGKRITVYRTGSGRNAREPIDLLAIDAKGTAHFARLPGERESEWVEFDKAALPWRSIDVDPSKRLVERAISRDDQHPRYDDSTSHRVRVTLGQLAGGYGTAGSEVTLGGELVFKREYELAHHFGVSGGYDPSGSYVAGRYTYSFGPRVSPDQLAYHLSAITTFDRFGKGYAGADTPIYVLVESARFTYDDRASGRTAFRGFAFNLHLDLGLPWQGHVYGQAGAGILKIIHLSALHALALRLRADGSIGDLPLQAEFALGGRFAVRGFAQNYKFAAQRGLASAEWRHDVARGFRTNLGDALFVDGVEGALFTDVALLGNTARDIFSRDAFAADIGYGLRFLLDQAGINPGVLSVDFGIPLTHFDPQRPISVYVGFAQSFAQF
jgi:hypothetical protein